MFSPNKNIQFHNARCFLDFLTLSITAEVNPVHYVIHPGESFTINCTLNPLAPRYVDPALLYFQHLPIDEGINFIPVATEAHQLVGNDTMQIHVTHVKLSDTGYYICYHPGWYHGFDDIMASFTFTLVEIGGNDMSCCVSHKWWCIARSCNTDAEYMRPYRSIADHWILRTILLYIFL